MSLIRTVGASCAFALALATSAAAAMTPADVVYTNGKFITLDLKSSIAQAVAIDDGKFVAVGTNATVQAFVGAGTKVIDLGGQTVIPGLNDTHAHFGSAGAEVKAVPLRPTRNVAEALEAIRKVAATKKPGEWIVGSGWHPPSQLAEKRYLTRGEIDRVAPNNPVWLPTVGHIGMANSAALKLGGIDRNTPDPEGGVIEKDSAGEPNGVLYERAMGLVTRNLPPPTIEELEAEYLAAMQYVNSFGLTSLQAPGIGPQDFQALQRLMLKGQSTVRVLGMYRPNPTVPIEEWRALMRAQGASTGFGNEWLKFSGIKISIDGGMTLRTAFTRAAYPDDADYHGISSLPPEKLKQLVSVANEYDWRLGVHCVGDAACDQVLDAFEAADKEKSIRGRRFALIHGSLIQRDQLERAKRLDVRLELQNVFMWDKAVAVEQYLGLATANRVVPVKMAIDILGIDYVAEGTDYSTNLLNPFIGLYIAVTRKDPRGRVYGADQAVTREQALRLYTLSGAYAGFDEAVKGSIEPGKLADMVVLSKDYMSVPAEEIKDIQAVQTIVGGKVVFQR